MSLVQPEINRDSFDHLNRNVYEFWTMFALSITTAIVAADFLSGAIDQFGPLVKAMGTLALAVAIAVPAPVWIGGTILEGKDQNYLKCLMDFPLHPGGLLLDLVEQGIVDLVTKQEDVPVDPNSGKPTGEAKVPKSTELLNHVVQAKAVGFHSFAVHVEVPQHKWPGRAAAYQPVEDLIFDSPVTRAETVVPEMGSGVYKGVQMKRLAHQAVIGCFYVRSLRYTISSKPVPIFRVTFCRGESLRQLRSAEMLAMTKDDLAKIETAYSTLGSVTLKMDNERLEKENEELRQQQQFTNWDNHAKAAKILEMERQAFGSSSPGVSTWRWLGTRKGIIGLSILAGIIAVILFSAYEFLQAARP